MRAAGLLGSAAAPLLLLPGLLGSGAAPLGERSASEYLSEEPFPGLHILERVGEGPQLLLHRRGQHPRAAGRKPAKVDASRWAGWAAARQALERRLGIPEREPFQSQWAVFDAQGRPIDDLATLRELPVAFILEIGQWMWPAVRVGFEHIADSVSGDSPAILRTLSLRPVVFEVRDFITKSEAGDVMEIGRREGLRDSKGSLQSADVRTKRRHTDFRTSKQAWLHNGLAPIVAELDERVANLTRVPASHNEPVQLLRYNEGQYYHGHMDWTELELYNDQREIWLRSHFGHQGRLATVFWYLNDVEEGGETIFPKHGQPICKMEEARGGLLARNCPEAPDPIMSSCESGLKVPPRRGTVVLWYNFHPSGRGDRNALHAGCPVGGNATKWSANKWVRIKEAEAVATWVDGHPALRRHGWVDKRPADSPADPRACNVAVTNAAASPADLMWYHPDKRSYKKIASVEPGGTVRQKSFKDHAFQLWSGTQRSQQVKCRQPRSEFVLERDFRLRRLKDNSEL